MPKQPKIDIDIDVKKAIREVRSGFKHLSQSQVNKATARAINEVISKAHVFAAKTMRAKYRVRGKDIKKTMRPYKATQRRLTATIGVVTRPMPLMAFSPRKTKHGVSVNIAGKRSIIRSAFIATMKSNHKGVFARGRYRDQKFTFRTKRLVKTGPDLPIDELVTVSPYSMLANAAVSNAVAKKMESDFVPALLRQMKKVDRGF